ncbi:Z385D protein, partial [Polypterus senegalus]
MATAATTVLTICNTITNTETPSGANKKQVSSSGSNSCPPMETEEEKAKRLLYCSLCKVAVNSASQLEAHNSGTKHKTMLEARSGSGTIKAFPRLGIKGKVVPIKAITGLQNKTFHCEICNVHVNSETQLKQVIDKDRSPWQGAVTLQYFIGFHLDAKMCNLPLTVAIKLEVKVQHTGEV